jgi:transposase
MDTHKNAPMTPKGREMMVRAAMECRLSKAEAARRFNTTPKTVAKWVERFRLEGLEGLRDRSSRPFSSPSQAPPAVCSAVEALRRRRYTGKQIAVEVGVSAATVSRILRRLGLSRLAALEPAEPVRRYERAVPGEIVHIDIKKLGKFSRIGHRITGDRNGQSNTRGIGWEYVHLAIDDHSRVAYSEILPDEKRGSCLRFLFNTLRFFHHLGVKVRRVMTDNGSSFRSRRYAKALRMLNIKHLRTRPYTPKGAVTGTWLWSKRKSEELGSCSGHGRRTPILQRFASEGAERGAGNKMALNVERIVDGGVNRQEPLR